MEGINMLTSVIMTAFNAATTIEPAIRSILAQSHHELELLVCNDASTDTTAACLRSLRDPRLRICTNSQNIGPGPTRDRLLTRAKGDWITFCDADDMWQPDRIERMVAATKDDPYAVVFDDILYCHHTKEGLRPWRRMRGPNAFGAKKRRVSVPTTALVNSQRMLIKPLFSRELLESSRASHGAKAFGEDCCFLLKLLASGGQLVYVPEPLYLYRITPGSASINTSRHEMLAEVLQSAIDDFSQQPEVQEAIAKKISRVELNASYLPFLSALKEGKTRSVLRMVAQRPSFLFLFITRAIREIPYQLDRIIHGGAARFK
jgi:succinoglycan biosynthesis protein ExoO